MGLEARREAKKLAEQAFSIARDRILEKYGDPGKFAQEKTGQTGNSGAYAPALIEWASGRVRESILAFADAYAQAFDDYDIPCDPALEEELKAIAQQMTAGTISAVIEHKQLHSRRTRARTQHLPTREIEHAQRLAVREGTLVLRRQRIEHVKANTLSVLGEEGLVTGTETLEQWHQALLAYLNRFEGLGHFGDIAERWFRFQRQHYEQLENKNAQHKAALEGQRELILQAWLHAKTAATTKPEVWKGYRNEFRELRREQQQLPASRNRSNRLETVGDFASGFKIMGGDSLTSANFSEIAVRAGRDLGPPDGFDSESFWHSCIFFYLREQGDKRILLAGADGDDGGTVRYPLEASEQMCSWLAAEALRTVPSHAADPTATQPTVKAARSQRPGPKTDLETALRVKAVVDDIAPNGDWKSFLEPICTRLDEQGVKRPKPWKTKGYMEWSEVATVDKALAVKAISHHLENARKDPRETLA